MSDELIQQVNDLQQEKRELLQRIEELDQHDRELEKACLEREAKIRELHGQLCALWEYYQRAVKQIAGNMDIIRTQHALIMAGEDERGSESPMSAITLANMPAGEA